MPGQRNLRTTPWSLLSGILVQNVYVNVDCASPREGVDHEKGPGMSEKQKYHKIRLTMRQRFVRLLTAVFDPRAWAHGLKVINYFNYTNATPWREVKRGVGGVISPLANIANPQNLILGDRVRISANVYLWPGPGTGRILLADDVMIGLKPGDEMRGAVLFCHFAKADEGVHLVRIAAHRFGEFLDAAHLRVGLVLHQPRIALEPPQHLIEQPEARRIGMKRGAASDSQKALAGTHRRRIRGRRRQAMPGRRQTAWKIFHHHCARRAVGRRRIRRR